MRCQWCQAELSEGEVLIFQQLETASRNRKLLPSTSLAPPGSETGPTCAKCLKSIDDNYEPPATQETSPGDAGLWAFVMLFLLGPSIIILLSALRALRRLCGL